MAEEKETGFNPETYTHILPKGVPDFDDYTEEDLQQDPELGLTDEEVAAEVAKLSEEDKKLYEQIKTFTDSFYRQHGYIIPITDLIQVTMMKRFPGIPTQTAEQQEELRQELLQEVRKRKHRRRPMWRRRHPARSDVSKLSCSRRKLLISLVKMIWTGLQW